MKTFVEMENDLQSWNAAILRHEDFVEMENDLQSWNAAILRHEDFCADGKWLTEVEMQQFQGMKTFVQMKIDLQCWNGTNCLFYNRSL